MKKILALTLCLLILPCLVMAADVNLSWDAPTTNEDGTPLTDLSGYKVYYGNLSGEYNNTEDVGNLTTYKVTNLGDGEWYFVVTAYDTSGNESAYSNEVSEIIDGTPSAPVLKILVVLIEDGKIKDVYVNNLKDELLIN